jgi:hypothetical protein
MRRFIDLHLEQKKQVPSPDQYSHPRKHFNDMNKRSIIYPNDRQTSMDEVIKTAKKTPGVCKYNITSYDEKMNKKPKGNFKLSEPRVLPTEETMAIKMEIPAFYNPVTHYSIKPRPYQQVKYHKDSERANELKGLRE